MGKRLAVVLVAVGPLDVLGLALLHANDAGLELGGELLAVEEDGTVLAGEVRGALDILDGHVDDVALGDLTVILGVLVGSLVREELVDLPVDLGVGGLLGGHVDLGGVIALELDLRANVDLDVDLVLGALNEQLGLLAEGEAADGGDVHLLEHGGLEVVQEVVGCLSEDALLAQHGVNDGTRGLAATEALEAVLLGDVLVGLLDSGIDVGSGDGDLGGQRVLLALRLGNGDVQRSSSVSCSGGPAPPACSYVAAMVRAKGLEPSRSLPHWNLNPARLPVPPRPHWSNSRPIVPKNKEKPK